MFLLFLLLLLLATLAAAVPCNLPPSWTVKTTCLDGSWVYDPVAYGGILLSCPLGLAANTVGIELVSTEIFPNVDARAAVHVRKVELGGSGLDSEFTAQTLVRARLTGVDSGAYTENVMLRFGQQFHFESHAVFAQNQNDAPREQVKEDVPVESTDGFDAHFDRTTGGLELSAASSDDASLKSELSVPRWVNEPLQLSVALVNRGQRESTAAHSFIITFLLDNGGGPPLESQALCSLYGEAATTRQETARFVPITDANGCGGKCPTFTNPVCAAGEFLTDGELVDCDCRGPAVCVKKSAAQSARQFKHAASVVAATAAVWLLLAHVNC